MVKEIAKPDIRNSIKISKNTNFNDYFDINEKDKVNVTYTRFLIVATNIAEASITIDTLKYVIDTGNEVVVGYDILNDTSNNKKESITESSRKQRKGRIGRVAPGTIYYKYDHSNLSNKPNYKICIQNIQSIILDMIVTITGGSFGPAEIPLKIKYGSTYIPSQYVNHIDHTTIFVQIPPYFIGSGILTVENTFGGTSSSGCGVSCTFTFNAPRIESISGCVNSGRLTDDCNYGGNQNITLIAEA
jgi:hypothetical protein